MKKVLSIAGSDCSGGAGIQADLKTFSAFGVFGMSVIVSVVAENTSRVIAIQNISPEMIGRQIDAIFEDIEVDAVKIGMLSNSECMEAVDAKLQEYSPQNIVIDPVMYAKNGCPLMEPAILGGCTMVQLREKGISSSEFYRQAIAIKQIAEQYHVPLIINDRFDIAMAVKAAGVHIGQSDLPASVARRLIGANMLLGVSAATVKEAMQAEKDGADYLGVGAMFPTGTKTDASFVSMEELQKIRHTVDLPIVVIGGINKENAGMFHSAGIEGLAVVSAIIAQPDIRNAAAEIKECFTGRITARCF